MSATTNVGAAESKKVITVEAVVTKADGSRVDYGVIATSDPERVPPTPRPEEE
jgi:hypothetical protein